MLVFSTELLLTFKPKEALIIAINNALSSSLHPSYVTIGEVTDVVGLKGRVIVTASTQQPNSDENRFTGAGPVVITRIDIGSFFEGEYIIDYDTAITSFDVARMITDVTGIQFDERDFVESVITEESNKLVAAPHSLRWVGELPIVSARGVYV